MDIVYSCSYQDLSDWVEISSKALSILQSAQAQNSKGTNTGYTTNTLTEDQRIGRELYLFAEKHERKSQASQIYANVGLACLGIHRLLQACYPFLNFLFLTHVIGPIG